MFRLRPSDAASTTIPIEQQLQGHQPVAPETELGHTAVAALAGDGSAKGQGFRSDARVRRAIELRAMAAARDHYTELGWALTDVSATKPYDFIATQDGHEKHLEVKGTTSGGQEILLTPNEVSHARTYHSVALVICHSIALGHHGQELTATGGQLEIYDPWLIDEGHLSPVGYAYAVPGTPG